MKTYCLKSLRFVRIDIGAWWMRWAGWDDQVLSIWVAAAGRMRRLELTFLVAGAGWGGVLRRLYLGQSCFHCCCPHPWGRAPRRTSSVVCRTGSDWQQKHNADLLTEPGLYLWIIISNKMEMNDFIFRRNSCSGVTRLFYIVVSGQMRFWTDGHNPKIKILIRNSRNQTIDI